MADKIEKLVFIASMIPYKGKTVFDIINADTTNHGSSTNLVHQATQPFFATVATSVNAFGKIDKTYIVCENDKVLSPTAQRKLIKQIGIGKSITLNTGHVPHVENPDALALAILNS